MSAHGKLTLKDLSEIAIGAVVVAFPVAFTEEAWEVPSALGWTRLALISVLSLTLVSWFVFHRTSKAGDSGGWPHMLMRIGMVYGFTFVISIVVLFLIGKWPIMSDPELAMQRALLVTFVGSFGATIIDSLG